VAFFGRWVALLNDAFHNLSDVPPSASPGCHAAGPSAPRTPEKTYGYLALAHPPLSPRSVLVVLALWLGYESIERFGSPSMSSKAG